MKTPKNALLVELYDLAITPGSNKYFGKVVTKRFLKEDDLVNIAVKRRTELNATTLRAAIEILQEVAMEELLNVTIRPTTSCPPDSLPLSLRQKSYVKKQTQSRRLVFAD